MEKNKKEKMPLGKREDVEFSHEEADAEDLEAAERAKKADERQERGDHVD
ncbi:MAG: YfhD family protein [Thermicanus sp.]|nr:YfhD family protein [Thermicanus sp.]